MLNDFKSKISKNLELMDLYEYSTTEESKEKTNQSIEFVKKVQQFKQQVEENEKIISLDKLVTAIGLKFIF
jgi:hypothetical protein